MIAHHTKKPVPPERPRFAQQGERRIKVDRIGAERPIFRDLYARLLAAPWWVLAVIVTLLYFVSNLAFALVYAALPGGVENANTFGDLFFFSVQTMATIGYGKMTPVSFAANILVAVEALWGFVFFALMTGLGFAKFSRPTARVLFSNIGVVSDFEGERHLKIRLANQRKNGIVGATANLYLLANVMTKEGVTMRRLYDLPLVRHHMPMLQLTWTLMHPINEASPLYGMTAKALEAAEAQILVSLVGLDETLSQTIQARHSYLNDEVLYDAFYEDVLTRQDGRIKVDYTRFHSVRKDTKPKHDTETAMD
jgi:inward rectifier potassium channel